MAKTTKKLSKPKPYSSKDFLLDDYPSTLFPLATNKALVERGADKILSFAQEILDSGSSFLPQRRVYANKDPLHLRRTVKLDPVAELFWYDLIFRNRSRFRKPHSSNREHFGYRFVDGRPISASQSYREFKENVWEANFHSEEFIYFDVSSYFNGVYHHDLQAWFSALGPESPSDVQAFGKFLREINAGRSLDCLPQGLYPSKMVGNDFLRFIEDSSAVRSDKILRFMDDTYLFDDSAGILQADFAAIQRLLGLKGLSVNASKTRNGGLTHTDDADNEIDEVKKRILQKRRQLIVSHYGDDDDDNDVGEITATATLDEEEIAFILSKLDSGVLSEDDAELIMIVMRDHVDRLEGHLDQFAVGYPHLAKNFFGLCAAVADKERVSDIVLHVANQGDHIGEYQLFWLGMMLENYLLETKLAPDIVYALYNHHSATDISKSKILEIRDNRFGLPEMRETFLREGRSDWLTWASAVGSLALTKQARNYLLGYFANGSTMNKLIADILQGE